MLNRIKRMLQHIKSRVVTKYILKHRLDFCSYTGASHTMANQMLNNDTEVACPCK